MLVHQSSAGAAGPSTSPTSSPTSSGTLGTLIMIGGAERKDGKCPILREVCRNATNGGKLVLVTAATQVPLLYLDGYLPTFYDLGVRNVDVLDIRSRSDAYDETGLGKLRDASVVFFTGGQQLRIGSQLGGSPVYRRLREMYTAGATIAGTSAGAAAMSETMLISGHSGEAPDAGAVSMAPGLGLAAGMVVDSHFSQRGRIGRLMAAVAQNPANLGLGIDEDTAVVMDGQGSFRVVGSGAVYLVDGREISYSSLAHRSAAGKLSVHDVRLHVLRQGDRFDGPRGRPVEP